MPWTLPTPAELVSEFIARWKTERATAAVGPGSDVAVAADVIGGGLVYGAHLAVKALVRSILPNSAEKTSADAWGETLGVPNGQDDVGRILPSISSGTDAVTVTATGSTADLQFEQFTDEAGLTYQITESYSFPGSGTQSLDAASISTGFETNLKVSQAPTLTFVSLPTNVTGLVLAADLDGGTSLETDADLRARYMQKLRNAPLSGNQSHWRQTIEEAIPGTLEGWVFPQRQNSPLAGNGLTDYTATQAKESGIGRIITAEQGTIIDSAVTTAMRLGTDITKRRLTVVSVVPYAVDFHITMTMASGATSEQLCDWDAELGQVTVTTATESTKQIICSGAIDTVLSVGDRVIIDFFPGAGTVIAQNQHLSEAARLELALVEVEAVVATVGVGGTDRFTTETWPNGWTDGGMSGSQVLSGGGIIGAVAMRITELVDSLGPVKGDYSADWEGWEDTVRKIAVQSAAIQAAGGAVADVTTALTDTSTTADTTSSVNMIIGTDLGIYEAKP